MADGGVFGDREQFWRDHVAGWKSSGMSLRLYSEEHGLKAGTLGYWNSRLKAQAADAPASSAGPEAAFLAVHVAPGRPEGFHLQPPTEPCVNLSIYTARPSHCPATLRCQSTLKAIAPPDCPVGDRRL